MPITRNETTTHYTHVTLEEPIDLERDPTSVSESLEEHDFRFEKTDNHRIEVSWAAKGRVFNADTPDGEKIVKHRCGEIYFSEYDSALAFLRGFYSSFEGFGSPQHLRFHVSDLDDTERWSRRNSKVH